MTEQFNSGESSFIFRTNFHKRSVGLMIVGKHVLAAGGGAKRIYQYYTDVS